MTSLLTSCYIRHVCWHYKSVCSLLINFHEWVKYPTTTNCAKDQCPPNSPDLTQPTRLPCVVCDASSISQSSTNLVKAKDHPRAKQDSWAIAKKTARCALYMGALKSFESPHYTPGYFSRNLQWTFVPIDTTDVRRKVEVRCFIRSWDNRGYSKTLGSPCRRPRSIFSQIFNWLLLAWTLWIYLPNLTFVALPIPEIIGGNSKSWGVPGFAHAPYSPRF